MIEGSIFAFGFVLNERSQTLPRAWLLSLRRCDVHGRFGLRLDLGSQYLQEFG
jgi:hypothetical protein